MLYAFVLGRNTELSCLEILQVLASQGLKFKVILKGSEILMVEFDSLPLEFRIDFLMSRFGGVIKIIKIEHTINNLSDNLLIPLLLSYRNKLENVNGRFCFGFSLYRANLDLTADKLSFLQRQLFKTGIALKRIIQGEGGSAKCVVSRDRFLSSVVVEKQHLLTKGVEYVCIASSSKLFYIGVTLAIQDFAWYSKIDYGRPGRDDIRGMLPPKLAQMMINMSGAAQSDVLYDPFCGSGTIITQAMSLGYNNILGSDFSDQAVADTEANVSWMRSLCDFQKDVRLFQKDVREIAGSDVVDSIDTIVTEPVLGTPQRRGGDTIESRRKELRELEGLYGKALIQFHKMLKNNGTVVMIFPVFRVDQKTFLFMDILKEISDIGFNLYTPFSNVVNYSNRGSILYERSDQHVLREIFIWKKKNVR